MKQLILIPLVLIFIISCQDKKANEELENLKTKSELTEQNKALIRDLYEEWNNRNADVLLELHAPNAKYHHPSVGSEPILFEEAIEQMKMIWDAFPDITIDIEDLFAEGNKVIVRFIARATHTKDFGGIPATGIMTEVSAMEMFHIKDNRIVEVWEISDRLGLMQQLGMELKLMEATE
jgi:steroid delta-isomerase-like uncharacterized protein